MDQIIAKYELRVYSSGHTELIPLSLKPRKIDLSQCSSRIHQILACIIEIKNQLDLNSQLSESEIYSEAIKKVANQFEVSPTTISDKLTRQLNLNASKVRNLIFNYFNHGSDELKTLLLKFVGKNTKNSDINAINLVL